MPKRGPGNPSVIVCNHHGWLEIMSLIASPVHPGFTPKEEVQSMPLLGKLTDGLQSLYISRAGTLEERDRIVESIIERQRMIEDRCIDFPPFAVFAEATTTNATVLFPFKRGAFQGMRTVIPSFTTFDWMGQIRPIYDTVEFFPLIFLLLSSF